nr:hypothetical protein GCM10020093_120230 [Planobispora longispora]
MVSLVFAEEQGSYLVGAAAALKSRSGRVGFIGGVRIPLLQKFEAGFAAGAAKARPGWTSASTTSPCRRTSAASAPRTGPRRSPRG